MTNEYTVDGEGFSSYFAAIAAAKTKGAEVIETATGLSRWRPALAAKAKTRHVLVNADGSKTEFGKVRR